MDKREGFICVRKREKLNNVSGKERFLLGGKEGIIVGVILKKVSSGWMGKNHLGGWERIILMERRMPLSGKQGIF